MKALPVLIVLAALTASGCATAWNYNDSATEVKLQAFSAHRLAGDGVGLGVDISAWDVLKQHPWRALGAAAVDVAALYGTYACADALAEELNDDDDDNDNPAQASAAPGLPKDSIINQDDGAQIVVIGNQNEIEFSTPE